MRFFTRPERSPARIRDTRLARTRSTAIIAASVAIAFALAGCTGSGSVLARPTPAHTAHHHRRASTPVVDASPSGAATTLSSGPDGIVSSAIVAENAQPGDAAWRITDQGAGTLQGFADHNYAEQGDQVGLYVSTDQSTFTATAYRMGWYDGAGARQVWQSATIGGKNQPACGVQHATNTVTCANWTRSLEMPITSAFVPGDYLIKLTGSGNRQSYIQLTVWNPASRATYLVMNRSMVEQGWNTFGGYDFYQGLGGCILDKDTYPPCNRARVVSFDRPYDGDGVNDFLVSEYPMVEFMEQQGLDVTYCTDICLSDHPAFIAQHRALIGLDHDETWTNSERVGVLDAAAHGVNMAFFGAATLVRHARLAPSLLGPDRNEVDYRNAAEDPESHVGNPWEVTGNEWTSSPGGWNPESFLGQVYSGYINPGQPNQAMTVYDPDSWFYAGSGLTAGSQIPGVIASDIEHLDPAGPMPQNLQVLAHSAIPLSTAFTNEGRWNGHTYSDATYYTNAAGAGIFDSGDNIWVSTLAPCSASAPNCSATVMRRLTGNVLKLFGQGPAAATEPSKPNWHSVTPAGS